jgi:hypothetical protein
MCTSSLHFKICKIVLWYECTRIIWMDYMLFVWISAPGVRWRFFFMSPLKKKQGIMGCKPSIELNLLNLERDGCMGTYITFFEGVYVSQLHDVWVLWLACVEGLLTATIVSIFASCWEFGRRPLTGAHTHISLQVVKALINKGGCRGEIIHQLKMGYLGS